MATFLARAGNIVDKLGTALRLPEFGISERLAGGRTAYTGISPQSQSAGYAYRPGQTSYYQNPIAYNAPVARNVSPVSPVSPVGQIQGSSTRSGGGGGGGSSGGGGAIGLTHDEIIARGFDENKLPSGFYRRDGGGQEQIAAPSIDFDSYINPYLKQLDKDISAAESFYGEKEKNIESSKATKIAQSKQEFGATEQELTQRKAGEEQRAESAVSEARRQFAEIQQGLQGRYGQTTGTGAFAAELSGRETLRNIGQIRQNLSQSLSEIDNKVGEIKELGRIALLDIEDRSKADITQARDQLQREISSIRAQKGELQARKAELYNEAMTVYQNNVAQIQQQREQFMNDLALKQYDAEQKLLLAKQRASNVAGSLQVFNYDVDGQVTPVGINTRTGQAQKINLPSAVPSGGRLYDVGTSQKKSDIELLLEGQGLDSDEAKDFVDQYGLGG